MGIFRIDPQKDTTIINSSPTANTGLSNFIDIFARINPSTRKKEYGRGLVKFAVSSLTAAINSGNIPNPNDNTAVTATLKLFNVNHDQESSESFNLEIYPLTQDWDEGNGIDPEFVTTGYANAVSAKSTAAWTVSGGTYATDSNSGSQSFDKGFEHLSVNVTSLVKDWVSGVSSDYGVLIKHTEEEECATASSSGINYNLKRFYSRQTNTYKNPYIQIEWPNEIDDDREAGVEAGSTGALYLYNKIGGKFTDLSGTGHFPGEISISGFSPTAAPNGGGTSAIFTGLSAERRRIGVYRCVIDTFPLSAAPGDTSFTSYADVWVCSGSLTGHSASSASAAFTVLKAFPGNSALGSLDVRKVKMGVRSFPKEIEQGDIRLLRTFFKEDAGRYTVLTGGSTASTALIMKDLRYQIRELYTDEVEVDWQPASRDSLSNYIDLDTSYLHRGVSYKLLFKFKIDGETQIIDMSGGTSRNPTLYSFEVM